MVALERFYVFVLVAMVTCLVQSTPINVDDPEVQEMAEYSLLQIGGGAELIDIVNADVQDVPGHVFTLTLLVFTYNLDRYGSMKILNDCKIKIVDEPDLRWVTELNCTPIDVDYAH